MNLKTLIVAEFGKLGIFEMASSTLQQLSNRICLVSSNSNKPHQNSQFSHDSEIDHHTNNNNSGVVVRMIKTEPSELYNASAPPSTPAQNCSNLNNFASLPNNKKSNLTVMSRKIPNSNVIYVNSSIKPPSSSLLAVNSENLITIQSPLTMLPTTTRNHHSHQDTNNYQNTAIDWQNQSIEHKKTLQVMFLLATLKKIVDSRKG